MTATCKRHHGLQGQSQMLKQMGSYQLSIVHLAQQQHLPVEELWPEVSLDQVHDPLLGVSVEAHGQQDV